MKKIFIQISFVFIISVVSCQGQPNYGKPSFDPEFILKDKANFVKYYYPLINLDEDFIALDQTSKVIKKGEFFKILLSGSSLPLKQKTETATYYRLYKMREDVSESIPATIKALAYYANRNYQMEGKTLPGFNFMDIEDNKFDSLTTKNKIVVLKTWFIGCQRCVEEMPNLNSIVKKYQNRTDVIFLSLATNPKQDLKEFLTKMKFAYRVIANQKDYINDTLALTSYPTHIIINKNGVIIKVSNNYEDMKKTLESESAK